MNGSKSDELREQIRPIASLIRKSEKAMEKLAPGTWQHTMLQGNLKALQAAFALMNKEAIGAGIPKRGDLRAALRAFATMTARSVQARMKFAPGTSQHTLLRNRLRAFRAAQALIEAELK